MVILPYYHRDIEIIVCKFDIYDNLDGTKFSFAKFYFTVTVYTQCYFV